MDKKMFSNTIKVGFAFALIMLFWNVYDFVVPLLLDNIYGLPDDIRGLVMGLDNLLSIFLLPLFGNLSDKSKSKMGKRKPYILFGTIVAVFFIIFVPLTTVNALNQATTYKQQVTVDGALLTTLYDSAISAESDKSSRYADIEYLNKNNITKEKYVAMAYSEMTIETKNSITKYYHYKNSKKCLIGEDVSGEKAYADILLSNKELELKTLITRTTNGDKELFFVIDGEQIAATEQEYSAIKADYSKFVKVGVNNYLGDKVYDELTKANPTSIAFYMLVLLFALIAMATFRSPAVALMPDVTPKPFRSQANAVINLAGGIGGAVGFLIYTIWFAISPTAYTEIFVSVGIGMIALLVIFMSLVNEPKMLEYCADKCKELNIEDDDMASENMTCVESIPPNGAEIVALNLAQKGGVRKAPKTKEEKAKLVSFFLILASIFMWFMGYNAITSNLSVYATRNLLYEPSMAGLITAISMAISAIAFIPVGFLSAKFGRKKTIVIGFILTILSFVLIFFIVRVETKIWFMIFYLISGFGLIIANVNTFPMVVELSSNKDVGKYTGFYYTATMSAQAITPYIAGKFMLIKAEYLFLYGSVCIILAVILMLFVKHGDSKPIPNK